MPHSLLVIAAMIAAPNVDLPTELWQVAPDSSKKPWAAPEKPGEKTRALVLIPGLHVHPLRPTKATRPELRDWQQPKGELVKTLAKDFDVFAFGYAQTVSVDDVAQAPGLRDAVTKLRKAGYKEIVLVGHSAGGVIARQFAESNPDSGVTKVIAVAAPFAGAEAATFKIGYPKVQAPFVKSLTPEVRLEVTKTNKLAIGPDVDFACVVCKLKRVETDGLVQIRSQWPEDLRQLGVPAVLSHVSHFEAMESADTAKTILELAKEKLKRWTPEEVEQGKKVLFGEPAARPSLLRREK